MANARRTSYSQSLDELLGLNKPMEKMNGEVTPQERPSTRHGRRGSTSNNSTPSNANQEHEEVQSTKSSPDSKVDIWAREEDEEQPHHEENDHHEDEEDMAAKKIAIARGQRQSVLYELHTKPSVIIEERKESVSSSGSASSDTKASSQVSSSNKTFDKSRNGTPLTQDLLSRENTGYTYSQDFTRESTGVTQDVTRESTAMTQDLTRESSAGQDQGQDPPIVPRRSRPMSAKPRRPGPPQIAHPRPQQAKIEIKTIRSKSATVKEPTKKESEARSIFSNTGIGGSSSYDAWVKRKNEEIKEKLRKQKEKEEEEQRKREEKKRDAKKTFARWKEEKDRQLKEAHEKQKLAAKRKKEQEEKEKEDKRRENEKLFEVWKRERGDLVFSEIKKRYEEMTEKERQKHEEQEEKRKEAEKAFEAWKRQKLQEDHEKKERLLKDEEEKKQQEEEDEKFKKTIAEEAYDIWIQMKAKERSYKDSLAYKILEYESEAKKLWPTPWVPTSNTVPRSFSGTGHRRYSLDRRSTIPKNTIRSKSASSRVAPTQKSGSTKPGYWKY